MVWASEKDNSWTLPCGDIQGMSNWEDTLGQNQKQSVEITYPILGMSGDPPGGAVAECIGYIAYPATTNK